MATLSIVSASIRAKLSAQQILQSMPASRADELQAIHSELYATCQRLQRIEGGQLIRLLGDEANNSLRQTLKHLREVLPTLAEAITARIAQESSHHTIQHALQHAFAALSEVDAAKPNREVLLQVARWILIAETDLYFSWLLTPTGNLDFFEQEQPRLLRFLTQYVLETIEQNTDYPFIQVMEVAIKQLQEILSRPLNKTETSVFKHIQEELSVELSANVVRLNPKGKSTQQGEYA